ncbi:PRC-barrel domain-containing protein [Candidatus Woesearchaeota archaeon]|nr:PRC-barrel domain-containing protein [Candidatus Woesearchaeota archaeon]
MEDKKNEKRFSRSLLGKTVVSKAGKRFGETSDLSFDTKTGELIHIILKNPTGYCEGLEVEKDKDGRFLIPYSSVLAIGDFIVVAEEDII